MCRNKDALQGRGEPRFSLRKSLGLTDRIHGEAVRNHGEAVRNHGEAVRNHGKADSNHGKADSNHSPPLHLPGNPCPLGTDLEKPWDLSP